MQDQAQPAGSFVALKPSDRRTIEETGSGGMCLGFRSNKRHLNRELKIQQLERGTSIQLCQGSTSHSQGALVAGKALTHLFFAPIACWAEDLQWFNSENSIVNPLQSNTGGSAGRDEDHNSLGKRGTDTRG